MYVRRCQITEQEFAKCADGEEMRSLEGKTFVLNGFRGNFPINSRYDWVNKVWLYWQRR